jgi:tRNA threonylcarbamoyladenosine biosynthesis protein TsaE
VICLRADRLADTLAIAAAIAPLLKRGDCVLLAGEMGAGKTAFTKALAAALGVTEVVTSPTFTLLHTYVGDRLTIHHVDVYRLDRTGELDDLALRELLDDAVVVVEWGDAVRDALPDDRLEIGLSVPADDTTGRGADAAGDVVDTVRFYEVDAQGRTWAGRSERLEAALERWSVPC